MAIDAAADRAAVVTHLAACLLVILNATPLCVSALHARMCTCTCVQAALFACVDVTASIGWYTLLHGTPVHIWQVRAQFDSAMGGATEHATSAVSTY